MKKECVNCPGAEDHSTAQCPLVSEQKNELRQIVTDALVSMVSGVTGLVPPTGPGAIPDFIQAPIDRAVEKISASLPVGVPDGYAIVPVKPDIEMVEAGYEASLGQPDRSAHARVIEQYDAMLAAAPTVKAGQRAAQSAGVPDVSELQRLLDDVRDVRNADDVAFGWYEAVERICAPAAPTVNAQQVQCDPRDIAGDTGRADVDAMIGRLTSADPDFNDCADAAALLRRLVMEEISGPKGYATWRDAAVAERVRRVAMKPNENIVHIARDGLEVYAGPNMNERKVCAEIIRLAEVYSADPSPSLPAAGSAVEEVEFVAWRYGFSGGVVRDSAMPDDWRRSGEYEPLMTVAQHNRIVAALSAQQSAPERVSVPVELLERLETWVTDDCSALEELRALLAQRERGGA